MALITCKDCSKEFSNDADSCPNCGKKKYWRPWRIFLAISLIGGFLWLCLGDSSPEAPARSQADIMADKYQMIKRHGSNIDLCAHAGNIAEMYVIEHKEEKYQTWKLIQRQACIQAGIPPEYQ